MHFPIVIDEERKILVRIVQLRIALTRDHERGIRPEVVDTKEQQGVLCYGQCGAAIQTNVCTELERMISAYHCQRVEEVRHNTRTILVELSRSDRIDPEIHE